MKRIDLIKKITKLGAVFVRHGSDHDWYTNHKTGVSQAIPQHNEVKEPLAKSIIKKFSSK
jgi:predicted RNA binding protein YcfA (HicA-like mRNA interferase family)